MKYYAVSHELSNDVWFDNIWEKKSLTVIDDVIRYLGNGALTKKWSDGFPKSFV